MTGYNDADRLAPRDGYYPPARSSLAEVTRPFTLSYREVAAMRNTLRLEPRAGDRCVAYVPVNGVRAHRDATCIEVKRSGRVEIELVELGRRYRLITDAINVRRL